MTDKELVEGCIREDRKYQKILWNLYSAKLMSLCLRYCKHQEEAEDALMEAFVRIYDKLPTFRYQSSLETWMRRIAVNTAINKLRIQKDIWQELSESEYELGYEDFSMNELEAKQIMKLVEQLPLGYRMVFNMFVVEGYSHKEIAEALAIDEGTSRSQLAKAKKALQQMLSQLDINR
jgi:RNA polymerase sigma-70 factor (ECF subfamily)